MQKPASSSFRLLFRAGLASEKAFAGENSMETRGIIT